MQASNERGAELTGKLPTDSYKGVRDFYPEDMAIQRYIFDTWSKTAESFGFERYDASVLEPSNIYKAKGAENEEMVNEQTYTFVDRGEREVTLRPEMTPTVARMVAGKQRELAFPLRWYSIPNLFRYERPQKGRLREHWQLNCDIFGADDYTADVEIIALAYQTLINFGAKREQFEILINNRLETKAILEKNGVTDVLLQKKVTQLNDRKNKISEEEYANELSTLTDNAVNLIKDLTYVVVPKDSNCYKLKIALEELGIKNVRIDYTLARGFDYYTGTIFEVFELDNNGKSTGRSLIGGGRYDNLTGMFSDEAVSGIGFGMGDVTMRDFLEAHNLLADKVKSTAPEIMVIPMEPNHNLNSQKIAGTIRAVRPSVATDISLRKIDKKISAATKRGNKFILVVGDNEINSGIYTLKSLGGGTGKSGTLLEITDYLKTI